MTTATDATEFLKKGLRNLAAWPKPSAGDDGRLLAAGLEPVAWGMLKMASISTQEYVKVTKGGGEDTPFPLQPSTSKMAVLLNPEPEGCHCSLAGYSDLAPRGRLGLRAVMYHEAGAIGLVLSQQAATALDPLDQNAYAVVTVDTTGSVTVRMYSPYIHHDTYIQYALGVGTLGQAIKCRLEAEDLGTILRVPNPSSHLAVELLRLGKYFATLAQMIDQGHKH